VKILRGFTAPREFEVDFSGDPALGTITRRAAVDTRGIALVKIPPEAVPEEGWMKVVLRNTSGVTARLRVGEGMMFAPRAGTFAGAVARWAVLEAAKAAFLVILTCAAATFLTFPIPALVGGTAAVAGYLLPFLSSVVASPSGVETGFGGLLLVGLFRALFADLGAATVVGRVAQGTWVPAGIVAWAVGEFVLLRGAVIAGIGAYVAGRKEYGA
jgi:hypothetical protein